jgi:phosphoglycerate dehydrogenase-like enzyme
MLFNKSVLVIGFGGIARELIPRLLPFGVNVSVLRKTDRWGQLTTEKDGRLLAVENSLVDRGIWPRDIPRLAGNADIIIVTCKQDESNKGLINEEFLRHCKTGVRIVNVARGGLIDYVATLKGLESGKIGGMGLDVQFWEPFDPEDPIAVHPQVYLTPHVAGVTEESCKKSMF